MAGQNGLIGSFKEWSDAGKHAKRGEPRFMVNRAKNLMARKPITMRHIKEILRLKNEKKLSVREIARSCALPTSTVGDYLKRAQGANNTISLRAKPGVRKLSEKHSTFREQSIFLTTGILFILSIAIARYRNRC
ncbi:hypothetical protein N9B57_00480 [Verrucomicrobia bacterium]|nr:hypothetical protein [Verrucomicrobiota bacterium]MDA7866387.1 hypothetical protein [Verrucomicrobiota bacterium]